MITTAPSTTDSTKSTSITTWTWPPSQSWTFCPHCGRNLRAPYHDPEPYTPWTQQPWAPTWPNPSIVYCGTPQRAADQTVCVNAPLAKSCCD